MVTCLAAAYMTNCFKTMTVVSNADLFTSEVFWDHLIPDTCFVIWECDLVQHFRNSPWQELAHKKCFDETELHAYQYLKGMSEVATSRHARQAWLTHARGLGFKESKVGMYSNMHENSAYV